MVSWFFSILFPYCSRRYYDVYILTAGNQISLFTISFFKSYGMEMDSKNHNKKYKTTKWNEIIITIIISCKFYGIVLWIINGIWKHMETSELITIIRSYNYEYLTFLDSRKKSWSLENLLLNL
jgi:hypothetical protein